MFVSPSVGIDDEWRKFAAHMRLPPPVMQIIARHDPLPEIDVPLYVFAACIAYDARPDHRPAQKSWADALKANVSRPRDDDEREINVGRELKPPSRDDRGRLGKVGKENAAPSGGVGPEPGKPPGPLTASTTGRPVPHPLGVGVPKAAPTPGAEVNGLQVRVGGGRELGLHPTITVGPNIPPAPVPETKTIMQTATSTIITDSKGVKTVVAKKGATASKVAAALPHSMGASFVTTTTTTTTTSTPAKKAPTVVASKLLVKETAPSSSTPSGPHHSPTASSSDFNSSTHPSASTTTTIVRQPGIIPKPSALPSGLPAHLADVNGWYEPPRWARYYVIKSYSEDDIHKSIKYAIWASTENGNKRLEQGWKAAQGKGPVLLFFSVNASGQFCGCAEMISSVDYKQKFDCWADDKWSGKFAVKWLFIKDIPNSHFRHIILENNEGKPVTNSRDTQEVPLEQGKEIIQIFKAFRHKTSILDDFSFYDKRQREMEEAKTSGKRHLLGAADAELEEPVIPPRELNKRKLQEAANASRDIKTRQ